MTTNEELIARLNSLANELEFQEDEMSQILSEAADRLAALTTPQEGDARYRLKVEVLSRHIPVLDAEGRTVGCRCMDRVFIRHQESWAEHMEDAIMAAFPVLSRADEPEIVEVAFKTVEVEKLGHLLVQLSPTTQRNAAATVRRLMEEMNIKEVVS